MRAIIWKTIAIYKNKNRNHAFGVNAACKQLEYARMRSSSCRCGSPLDKIAVRQPVKMRSTFASARARARSHSREITKRFRERVSSSFFLLFFSFFICSPLFVVVVEKHVYWHIAYIPVRCCDIDVQLPYECIEANIVTDWYILPRVDVCVCGESINRNESISTAFNRIVYQLRYVRLTTSSYIYVVCIVFLLNRFISFVNYA